MESKDVLGWCLGRDAQGAPTLSECALMKGVEGRYFAVRMDREGNPITVRTYQRGETFFTSHLQALGVLLNELSVAVARHQRTISYLEEQMDIVTTLIGLEKEAGDGQGG